MDSCRYMISGSAMDLYAINGYMDTSFAHAENNTSMQNILPNIP